MWKEFRTFAMRGNVIDLAVGVVIGAAFGKIITSFVDDLLMPPLGMILGKVDFKNLFYAFDGKHYANLAEAKKATAVLGYGNFLQSVVDFLIVAFFIFLALRQMNRWAKPQGAPPTPATKDCPFCFSVIPLKARRCPHCTSEVPGTPVV